MSSISLEPKKSTLTKLDKSLNQGWLIKFLTKHPNRYKDIE